MNVPEIRQARAKAEAARDAVGTRMVELAETGGPSYEQATKEFDALAAEVGRLTRELEREIEREQTAARNGTVRAVPPGTIGFSVPSPVSFGGLSFQTSTGETVKALRADERLADLARGYGSESSATTEAGIGGLARAICFGPRNAVERAALGESSLTAGGVMVPLNLSAAVLDRARSAARVMQAGAMTVPLNNGNLTIARVLTDPSAAWRGESEEIASSSMTFGNTVLAAKSLACLVKISRELAEDAANAPSVIENAIIAQIGLELDRAALYGSGANFAPLGLKPRIGANGVGEISMGVNGAALDGYRPFIRAARRIAEANGPTAGLSAIMAPRTAADIDGLVDTLGQPLAPPEAYRTLTKYSTTQIPTNLTVGTSDDCSDIFVGDFSQILIGMAGGLTLEVSKDASSSDGNAFSQHEIWIKAVLRADIAVLREPWLTVITGVTGADE